MNRLWVRLSILFGVVVLIGAVTIIIAARLLVDDNFRDRFLPDQLRARNGLVETLADYHQRGGHWDGVELLMQGAEAASTVGPPNGLEFILQDAEKHIIYSSIDAGEITEDRREHGYFSHNNHRRPIPIRVDGQEVGYLQVQPHRPVENRDTSQTLAHFLSTLLLLLAMGGGAVGIIFGILTSRNLTSPLNRLAEAAREIGMGNYARQVEVSGSDEMQEVASAFNEMAVNLKEAETLRRNLVADVAHELRTPLTVVQGNLRALLDDVFPLEKSEIARLYDQTRILSRLVDDLREIAQAEAGQLQLNLQLTDIEKLIRDTTTTFEPLAEADGIALHVEIIEHLPSIQADPMRLSQVLHNLIHNALRHTPPGGTITVVANVQEGKTRSEIVLQVKDSGTGIAEEHLPFVFDRFYRIHKSRDRSSGGTGLGLAIVRAWVEAHGGEVNVVSEGQDQGSTFTIRLPQTQRNER